MVIPGSQACGSENRPAEELAWPLPEPRVTEYWSGITEHHPNQSSKEGMSRSLKPRFGHTGLLCLTNCKLQITTGRGLRTSA